MKARLDPSELDLLCAHCRARCATVTQGFDVTVLREKEVVLLRCKQCHAQWSVQPAGGFSFEGHKARRAPKREGGGKSE